MEWNGQLIWLSLWMGVWTVSDLKRKTILLWQPFLVFGTGVIWQLAVGQMFTWDRAGSILIGGLAWGFSCLSAEKLGKGDALVLLCMGLYLNAAVLLTVLLQALGFASLAAIYLMLVRKKTAQSTIPFVPFLTAGFVMFLVVG